MSPIPVTQVCLDRPITALSPVATVAADAVRAAMVLQGELDLAVAPIIAATLDAHFAAGRRYLRIDCSKVTFADTAVADVLLRAHEQALSRRGTLMLTSVGRPLARLLELLHLDRVLQTSPPAADRLLVAL